MNNIDKKVFSIQLNNIISSITNQSSSSAKECETLELYDSIYHDNLFLMIYDNIVIYKGKLQYDNNGSFVIHNCQSRTFLNDKGIKMIKVNRRRCMIQSSQGDIYQVYTMKDSSDFFDAIAFNNIIKIGGLVHRKKIKAIALGEEHILYLSFGGMVYAQGDNSKNQLGVEGVKEAKEQILMTSLLNYFIVNIFSGRNHSYAIAQKRSTAHNEEEDFTNNNSKTPCLLFSWGDNSYGQCGFEASKASTIHLPSIILYTCSIGHISLGENHSMILLSNGELITCGNNQFSTCYNSQLDYIDSLTQLTYNFLQTQHEVIAYIKASANSSMILSDKGTLILKGKIVNGTLTAYRLIKGIDYKTMKISFTDQHCLIFHSFYSNDIITRLEGIDLNEKVSEYNNINLFNHNTNDKIPRNTAAKAMTNNTSNYEEMFDDLLNEEGDYCFYDSNDTTDNSLYELRSYINLLGISLSSNYSSQASYRPSNLPPKTKEEELLHRKLVEDNRKQNMNFSKMKQQMEKDNQKMYYDKQESNEKKTQYWLKEIIPNWTIMKSNKNFIHYFFEGIPSAIRGQVWLMCVGNKFSITRDFYNIEVKKSIQLLLKEKSKEQKKEKDKAKEMESDKEMIMNHSDIYSKYIIKTTNKEKTIHLIDLDVDRTFGYLGVFKAPSPLCDALREILRAFVISRPDIGYVQGLSYIAATLLLQMDKYQSFVCLMNITLSPNILPFYRLDEKGILTRLEVFNEIFLCNLPKLYNHFNSLDILPEHYMIEWLMTIFTRNLHIDLAVRIWDIYMIDGISSLYKASIVILQYYERQFLQKDFDDIMVTLKSLEELKIKEDDFIDSMTNVKFTDKIIHSLHKINEDFLLIE